MDLVKDRELWNAAKQGSIRYGANLCHWGFSLPDADSENFILTMVEHGQRSEVSIRMALVRLFVWFDIEFWHAYANSRVSYHENALPTACFLLSLRSAAQEELRSTPSTAGDALRIWAARCVNFVPHTHNQVAKAGISIYKSVIKTSGKKKHWAVQKHETRIDYVVGRMGFPHCAEARSLGV